MSQVLEALDIQDDDVIANEDRPLASPERTVAATGKTCLPITLLRSILSVFTASKPESIPEEYGALIKRSETPMDYLCRTDPSLRMRTLSV